MVTLDDKFRHFSTSVLDKAQKAYEDQVRAIDERNGRALDAFKAEIDEKAAEMRDKILRQGLYEKKMRIARAKMTRKRRLMLQKDELMEELIHQVREELTAFAQTPEYGAFVEALIGRFLPEIRRMDGLSLAVRDEDRQLFKERIEPYLRSAAPKLSEDIQYAPLPPDAIGGLLLFNSGQTVRYDLTFRTMLEDRRSTIGEKLHEIFNKAGMTDE